MALYYHQGPDDLDPGIEILFGYVATATVGAIPDSDTRLAYLDADVSSRSTFSGGAVASVTNDVGITQAGADKVWGSAARTLTSFGTLVADAAAAVWGAVTRVLTAGTNIGTVDADVKKVNGTTVKGSGTAVDPWGPA
jgi:hypothetical protein